LALKLLIKILSNKGPEVEPYGTPDSMAKGEEEFPKVRTTKNLNEKSLWNQLI
jgi:hypothetical protein